MVKWKSIFFVDVEVEFAHMVGLSGRLFWRVAEKGRTSTCMWLMFWKKTVRLQVARWVIQTLITKLSMVIVHISQNIIEIRFKLEGGSQPCLSFCCFFLGWNPFHDFQFRGSNLSGDPSSTGKQVSLAPPQQKSTNHVFVFRHNPSPGLLALGSKWHGFFRFYYVFSSNKKTFQGVVSGNASFGLLKNEQKITLKLGILGMQEPCRSK